MKKLSQIIAIITLLALVGSSWAQSRFALKVNQPITGAPLTLGIPFPKGVLHSPDHVRVLNAKGREIPSQITEVTTWMPADESIKWIWVFFFCEDSDRYFLEYGKGVVRAPILSEGIAVNNNQRARGYITINWIIFFFMLEYPSSILFYLYTDCVGVKCSGPRHRCIAEIAPLISATILSPFLSVSSVANFFGTSVKSTFSPFRHHNKGRPLPILLCAPVLRLRSSNV